METSHFLAFRRAFCLASVFAFILLVQGPARWLGFRSVYRWGHRWHKLCRLAAGMTVRKHGDMSLARPTLFVSNHVSYLDIPALGSILDATFIAKAEIQSWPLFGILCKLQRTVFVKRERKYVKAQREELSRRFSEGDNLILFPEGTSGDGTFVLPFKSALFSAAEWSSDEKELVVQPVSIAYTTLDGIVLGRRLRPVFAWYGDMPMMSHFWRLLGAGNLGVDIVFHEPVTLSQFGSRKALAEHCEHMVNAGLSAALTGRWVAQETGKTAAKATAEAKIPAAAAAEGY